MEFFGKEDAAPSAKRPRKAAASAPLAERVRPRSFEELAGQDETVGKDSFLGRLLEKGSIPSLIFWGPPGCGKTTLALLIASRAAMAFSPLSAVTSGIKDVKAVIDEAKERLRASAQKTILFIDEIHRFNKAQQDAFLPHVEDGTIVLFGATTENPSFSIVAPLLSRCRVVTLKGLDSGSLARVLRRAVEDSERGLGATKLRVDDATLAALARLSDGDARRALNLLEQCAQAARPGPGGAPEIDEALLAEVSRRAHLLYDKSGEEHFNLISALHKSLRASDAQAALYWLARMLASGEDPLYVARRMVRFASEDIGLADPQALPQALAAVQSYQMLGSPEGELALAQAAIYLATAPKSNALYAAFNATNEEIQKSGALPVPLHIRNAPTKLMKEIGYGKGYKYDHDAPDHFSGQHCLPDALAGRKLYSPGEFGFEKEIAKRLEWWEKRRSERGAS